MKLFIITSRIPYPLDKGDKLRIYHQIKSLAKDNDLYLCALQAPFTKKTEESRLELESFCKEVHFIKRTYLQIFWSLLTACFSKTPFQTALFTSTKNKNKVAKLIQSIRPDNIYCQLTRAAEFVRFEDLPKTLDYMDAFSKGMERRTTTAPFYSKWLYRWEARKQKQYETDLFKDFDTHTIITEEDRGFINHPSRSTIKIIKNGVDFDYFKPEIKPAKYDIVFVGNMGYAPNIDAANYLCKNILPLIQKKKADVKILLAGTSPSKSVLKLQSKSVTVSGWMEDIREAYADSTLFIAPMRIGTGLQNKILEAMAMNKPCVSTSLAAKPIKAPNKALLVGDTEEELAAICLELLLNNDKRNTLSTSGHQFVKDSNKWAKTTERLNNLFFSN
jgi:sugar transferase (PEP-CTERM/EpsH1 system associated)